MAVNANALWPDGKLWNSSGRPITCTAPMPRASGGRGKFSQGLIEATSSQSNR